MPVPRVGAIGQESYKAVEMGPKKVRLSGHIFNATRVP